MLEQRLLRLPQLLRERGDDGVVREHALRRGVGLRDGAIPNGDVAGDSATNVTSHENIEVITDPLGNAWYDSSGNEIGDKCNFNFGPPLGGASGAEYNEIMPTPSGGHYWLQREWSNAASGYVQRS